MVEEFVTSDQREEWNAFVLREPRFSLLQSWEWGEIKKRLGWEAFRIAVRQDNQIAAAAQMLVKQLPIGNLSIAYIPRGPVGQWTEPEIYERLFPALHQIARQEHAIFLKVEPTVPDGKTLLAQDRFRSSNCTNQPCATIVLDMAPNLDTIFSQMRKSARRKIKDGPRKGLSLRIGTKADLPIFYDLMQLTTERAGFTIRPYKYYQTEFGSLADLRRGIMLFAYYEDQPVAVNVSYTFGEHAAFFHQASSLNTCKANPNYFLVWEAIKLLKEKGCHSYDLWGIPDEIGGIIAQNGELPNYERTDGLWGVYKFKSGFGKNVVLYPGAVDHVYQPIPYLSSSVLFSGEETPEFISKWAGLTQIENQAPALSYALSELKHVRSPGDLNILFREMSYDLRRKSGLLIRLRKTPISMQIEPTNCCNAHCTFCPGQWSAREKGYMDLDLFKRIVEEATIFGVQRIYLDLHGESMLHPEIVEMIRFVKSKSLAFHLTTNGTLFNDKKSEAIIRAGVTRADHIIFSILGDSDITHNSIMQLESLDTIRENIRNFLSLRQKLGSNGPVLETVFRLVDENKYEEEGYKDTWSGEVDRSRSGGPVSRSFANYKVETPEQLRTQSCQTIQERMTVYWNGAVTMCRHDLDGDHIVGDLRDQSIQEVWNGEQLVSLRASHREKRFEELPLCAHCDL